MPPPDRRLIVVSGLSGAGKTIALHALEDQGFYCIDNLPVAFLPQFGQDMESGKQSLYQQVAIGIDARSPAHGLSQFPSMLRRLKSSGWATELIFVEAEDDVLLKRFSETRRRHPLSGEGVSLALAIARERRLLDPLSECADLRIDTSNMHIHQLRDLIRERVVRRSVAGLSLQFLSFGYKHGVPPESDFVFDVRCLPNPHWDAALRDQSGHDPDVIAFLERAPQVQQMIDHIASFLATWVRAFEVENRVYLTVAVGCTGGRHRSVYVAERLAGHFEKLGKHVLVSHRDIGNVLARAG
ncbi:MAG: RNase adapter RapZ [Chromatiales bacterium]